VRQKVQHHPIGMLRLRPVAALAEHVQLGVLQPGQQAETCVQRQERIVAAPDLP